MTQNEQNMAIARAIGQSIDFFCPEHGTVPRDRIEGSCACPWCGSECNDELPNYTQNLDAIHCAWLTLTQSQRALFQQNLRKVVLGVDDPRFLGELSWLGEAKIANATAAQRAEAFLRTPSYA